MPYKRKSAELQTFALVGHAICTFDTIHYSFSILMLFPDFVTQKMRIL